MNLIPEITYVIVSPLYARIVPVVRDESGVLRYIKRCDPIGISYIWSPEFLEEAVDLERLTDIITYHSFGYKGFFKPSIAEVLVQIPKLFLEEVVAFEIIESPDNADDLNYESYITNYYSCHVATTRLYTSKELRITQLDRWLEKQRMK